MMKRQTGCDDVIEVTETQIAELAEDPNLESIHLGRIISEQVLYPVYDHSKRYNSITMEPEDEVIITKHRDGTYFIHFMSLAPRHYHYKAPWVTDEQTTMEDEAIYHV
jgi:hypothetical protein